MTTDTTSAKKSRGRPKVFDKAALDKAMTSGSTVMKAKLLLADPCRGYRGESAYFLWNYYQHEPRRCPRSLSITLALPQSTASSSCEEQRGIGAS